MARGNGTDFDLRRAFKFPVMDISGDRYSLYRWDPCVGFNDEKCNYRGFVNAAVCQYQPQFTNMQ